MSLFLSSEMVSARSTIALEWDQHLYGAMTSRYAVGIAELAQHLAEAFNLHPPQGYVQLASWSLYSTEVSHYSNKFHLCLQL